MTRELSPATAASFIEQHKEAPREKRTQQLKIELIQLVVGMILVSKGQEREGKPYVLPQQALNYSPQRPPPAYRFVSWLTEIAYLQGDIITNIDEGRIAYDNLKDHGACGDQLRSFASVNSCSNDFFGQVHNLAKQAAKTITDAVKENVEKISHSAQKRAASTSEFHSGANSDNDSMVVQPPHPGLLAEDRRQILGILNSLAESAKSNADTTNSNLENIKDNSRCCCLQ